MHGVPVRFGFQVAPVSPKIPDHVSYREAVEDCVFGQNLGYDAAWFLEHHFTDYYPTPSPLVFMAHVARACPGLGLGTSVLVLPWYHPVRLAEEILMLDALSDGPLHLGIGRGTAKLEYDAYGVDMAEARTRFEEGWRIIRLALRGAPFSFKGRHFSIPRAVAPRPRPYSDKIHFYGAIGSPASAEIMGELGLPPFCLAQFPDHLLARILDRWQRRYSAQGSDGQAEGGGPGGDAQAATLPFSIKLMLADSDEEAYALGRRYLPHYFDLQANHYEVDANHWAGVPGYEVFAKMLGNMRKLADPANLGPFMAGNLFGSAATVARRLEALIAMGFNYFMVSAAYPGVPQALRRDQYRRFATEVMPRFATATAHLPPPAETRESA
jgi:alkanesulfonate monooxygenase SsuD/methylene tetrahydromethanopterin reductase-like flavin-dependent oxidoreductase (luciferase family)